MRPAWIPAIGLALVALGAGCTSGTTSTLERTDVQFFKSSEEGAPGHPALILSGLAFDSALVVRGCAHHQDGDATVVLVELGPTHQGASGSFKCNIPILGETNAIVFGNKKALVWKRGEGPIN